jgi:crossover junction endodeoxyribonuclease RuvC
MTRTLFAGIDPGLAGGIAVLDTDGRPLLCESLPVCGTGAARRIDAAELVRMLAPYAARIRLALVEAVAAMPRQGVSSTFRFARATGAIEGTLAALGVPIEHVTPSTWKRRLGLTSDKEQTRGKAVALFPEIDLHRRCDHNRAEALLLAAYARQCESFRPAAGAEC